MNVGGVGSIIGFDRTTDKREVSASPSKSGEADSFSLSMANRESRMANRESRMANREAKSELKPQTKSESDLQPTPRTEAKLKSSKVATKQVSKEKKSALESSIDSRNDLQGADSSKESSRTELNAVSTDENSGEAVSKSESSAGSQVKGSIKEQLTARLSKSAESDSELKAVLDSPEGENVVELLSQAIESSQNEAMIREGSMQTFLNQMQSEFGIEPKAVIKAFASLDEKSLQKSPEETADKVLNQLNLKPDQLPKAERYYREMLLTTGESALQQAMLGAEVGAGVGLSLDVLSQKERASLKLDQAINDLNDSFFLKSAQSANITAPSVPESGLAALNANAQSTSKATGEVDETESTLVSVEAAAEEAPKADSGSASGLRAALTAATAPLAVGTQSVSASPRESTSRGSHSAAQAKTSGASSEAKSVAAKSSVQGSTKDLKSTLDQIFSESTTGAASMTEKPGTAAVGGTAAGSGAIASAMLKTGEGEAPENAKDIVRNAQLLVQKGGGEMKMQLRPEGLGEVHLKVAIKDGQVAVQMTTDTDSAKQALEKGLDDLKSTLASHRLHVDALKVEVNTDLAKQRFEQTHQESQREQARQMAQDFLGQFRNDREAFRQSFTDGFGNRGYQQPKRPAPPEPEPVSATAASAARAKSGSGSDRRLNLVA